MLPKHIQTSKALVPLDKFICFTDKLQFICFTDKSKLTPNKSWPLEWASQRIELPATKYQKAKNFTLMVTRWNTYMWLNTPWGQIEPNIRKLEIPVEWREDLVSLWPSMPSWMPAITKYHKMIEQWHQCYCFWWWLPSMMANNSQVSTLN